MRDLIRELNEIGPIAWLYVLGCAAVASAVLFFTVTGDPSPSNPCYVEECQPDYDYSNNPGVRGR